MEERSVFDGLVKKLSDSERLELLDRLVGLDLSFDEPLAAAESVTAEVDYEAAYQKMSVLRRLILFLRCLLTGRTREELVHEKLLRDVAAEIQAANPAIADFSRGCLTPAFFERVKELREALHVFREPLARVFGRRRAEFTAFLLGLEMPDIQSRLLLETTPYYHAGMLSGSEDARDFPLSSILPDAAIKRRMDDRFDDIVQFMPSGGRAAMYGNMRFLSLLAEGLGLPFERIMSCFQPVSEAAPLPCAFERIKDHVMRLADVLSSMRQPPAAKLIKALYLFSAEDMEQETKNEGDAWLKNEIARAEQAFAAIRRFNKTVPIALVARYVSGSVAHRCTDLGGGEDWQAQLKHFWRTRMERQLREFSLKRRQDELSREVKTTVESADLLYPVRYVFGDGQNSTKGSYYLTIALLRTYFSEMFPRETSRNFKTLLIDGQFYRDENRVEFTDAYSGLLKMGDRLEAFVAAFEPSGSIGRSLEQIRREPETRHLKEKKLAALARGADLDAEGLIVSAKEHLQSLARVLNGILYGEIGGKYDTLSNLGSIGGRTNHSFKKGLDTALKSVQRVATLLDKLYSLESASRQP